MSGQGRCANCPGSLGVLQYQGGFCAFCPLLFLPLCHPLPQDNQPTLSPMGKRPAQRWTQEALGGGKLLPSQYPSWGTWNCPGSCPDSGWFPATQEN